MRGRKPAAGAASVSVLFLGSTVPVLPAAASAPLGASWAMNEAPGSTVMHDSIGYPNDGHIPSTVKPTGHYYHFSGNGSVTIPSGPGLNPGSKDFDVSITFRWARQKADISLIQKGVYAQTGGQWKINLSGGIIACRVNKVIARSRESLPLNTFHTIGCHKRTNSIFLTVDGRLRSTVNVAVGSVTSVAAASIGGKANCPGPTHDCDYFTGDVAGASITYP